jgi:hypothetical protein
MIYQNESFTRLSGPWPIFIHNLSLITLLVLPLSPTPFRQFDRPFLLSPFCNALYILSIIPFLAFSPSWASKYATEKHMTLPARNYPGPWPTMRTANLVQVEAPFSFTYNVDSHHVYSYSLQALPPKSKAQPSNPDRVTRSQRAPVPNIPLPPRREPPTRKKVVSFFTFPVQSLSDGLP